MLCATLAEWIEREMAQVVEGGTTPIGVHVARGAALMWALISLDAAVERELMPALGI